MTEKEVLARYWWIPWREPIPVTCTDGSHGFACRICIALYGLSGRNVRNLAPSMQDVYQHLADFHPEEVTA